MRILPVAALLSVLFWGGLTFTALKAQTLSEALHYLEASKHQPEIFLPYTADAARVAAIQKGWNDLEPGQTTEEVRALIGAPDEIDAVFGKGERTDVMKCFQYTYLFERSKADEWGKAYNERYIRLSFNLNGQLVSANGFAVKGFQELIREQGLGFQFEIGLHETVRVNDLNIKLDFVLTSDEEGAGESSSERVGAAVGNDALFSVVLPDRQDNFKLSLGGSNPNARFKLYGPYKISLVAVPDEESVILIVE
jgi:hypothetical protein